MHRAFWGGECDRASILPTLQNNMTVGASWHTPLNLSFRTATLEGASLAPLPKWDTMSLLSGRSYRIRIENHLKLYIRHPLCQKALMILFPRQFLGGQQEKFSYC
ncbi:MAG: hypothetical protein RIE73_13740 [Coleofasciculus sp. C1-SOL-03]